MIERKATWELYRNAACCFEQILEATPHKTAAVRPLTSHLANHPSKMKKTYWAHQCWLTSKDLHSSALCEHWVQSRGLAKSEE